MAFPPSYGFITSTLHGKAEGPTLPEINKVSGKFVVVVASSGKGLIYLGALEKGLFRVDPELEVLSQVVDHCKPEDVKDVAKQVQRKFHGRLDVAVSNAGTSGKLVYDVDEKTGEHTRDRYPEEIIQDGNAANIINTNFLGSYYVAK
ncbi:uncharacterized protein A1O9_12219 [Exophiala aquamarina CBS 119918]|uniref:3-oxoacyl-[acyl-carrier protein] reductase n=1 Tax=Exophiala aquamarina CBS 119918 TaxID=1182545 RepID=A0A072NWA1_9EURO|nr:uncharacterized protein A1O9_12219 [Exophiala aquamarina CBS 119918]KEF51881.1 hypothetical protein A1O9_12219 [Exophiala aquamarina CBS 119918]